MKQPWQVGALFGVTLLIAIPAMGWLTLQAIESEKAESLARQQMELEQIVGRALWRMDTRLTPILAVEAARPTFIFQPFLPQENVAGSKKVVVPKPSPLLVEPSELVLLNFQLGQDNLWVSPQCVPIAQQPLALQLGLTADQLAVNRKRLQTLQKEIRFPDLAALLPGVNLPDVGVPTPQPPRPANQPAANQAANQVVASQMDVTQQSVPNTYIYNQGLENGNRVANPPFTRGQNFNQPPAQMDNDLASRSNKFQDYALRQRRDQQQQAYVEETPQTVSVREGVSMPIWVNSQLLLVRRVMLGDRAVIQGCWLDWAKMKSILLDEVRDLLPDVELAPVTTTSSVQLGRMLATIPVQLVVRDAEPVVVSLSPLRISLAVAWGTLLLATAATTMLLQGVVTLSERRGAFVSAVTHELRTPLTTFRMYAEMLAEGMVPDENQKQQYLQTLRVEADRLAHLVENVLQYARLERGRPGHRREHVEVEQLIARFSTRLTERAAQADFAFEITVDDVVRQVALLTDPAAVEQVLFNLVDNACKYAATASDRRLHLAIRATDTTVVFLVTDHGPGIDGKMARRLFRPFSKSVQEAAHSAPGVGLGLALSRRLARDLGGSLTLAATSAAGASFELCLPRATQP